ncbi:MAG: hypothetical protein HY658_14790 [Actinobacteria bacterium]|nr:hypothetical protein [Actinomycetota bacterium]
MRKYLVAALVAGMFVAGTGVARAHVSDVTARPNATIKDGGATVRVGGAIMCDAGENFRVRAKVTQPGAKATGRDTGVCTGAWQNWAVNARVVDGAFGPGTASLSGVAITVGDGDAGMKYSRKVNIS